MNKNKTIFCDIDGTLWKHIGTPATIKSKNGITT